MTVQVTALDRGGYSAYGGADYDPRERVINLDVFLDEQIDCVITYTATPTDFDYEENGISISAPEIVGNTLTFQFQDLNASGQVSLLVMFDSGAARRVTFAANPAQPFDNIASIDPTDDDDVDYGDWG